MTLRRLAGLPGRPLLVLLGALALAACGDEPATPRVVLDAPAAETPASASAAEAWVVPDDLPRPAMRYARFETFTTADGLPTDRTTCVLPTPDGVLVGTEHGLAVRRDGRFEVLGPEDGLSHPYVTSLARHPVTGEVWVGTLSGLDRISGGRITRYTQLDSGLMNDVVYHVLVDGDLVWVATAAGTSVLDTTTGTWGAWNQDNSIMHEPWCYSIARGGDRTFIGVWGGGIVERDDATGSWIEHRDPDGEMELDLLADDGPIHDVTSFVAYDAGRLWQSTYFGLSAYDGRQWRSYVAADTGLPGDFVHMVQARGHTAFIATDQGFAVFDGTTCVSYRRAEDGGCDVRTWRDGAEIEHEHLPTAPGDDYVLWAHGDDDEIWLATGHGLSHGVTADHSEGEQR